MKEQLKFRDPSLAKKVATRIKSLAPPHSVKFCHVCGTHEWTIAHYGLRTLLPETVDVIAGPGCPVCVVPAAEIDEAIQLASDGVTVTTFGDVIRVPSSEMSLQEARASGGDVRIVYSVRDAVKMAEKKPKRDFVFFAIGFETTAPSTAIEILNKPPENLSFLVSHRLIPPAMELLLGVGDLHIDGFIAPGHVSTIIGLKPYEIFPKAYRMPTIVAGFEPLDVLFAISMLLEQIKDGEARLENEYTRSVTRDGNVKAQKLIAKVFDVVDGHWRGLGKLSSSALALKEEFASYDARKKYNLKIERSRDLLPGCLCHLVMIGKIKPPECPLFMKVCTPQSPKGACMVSIEGTCRIWFRHKITEA
ncbi:MAG: hydrogenase formation protein HypD [Candidatus Bathyarchaeota archaeon]|nr:hydrogenase formation protein HypD [Candidatus Bathyarchaeota archaeon]MDH5713850.1 hydrogenase formation protein HypD [Candidatus Bathyarchaeota archaeon]